MTDTFQTLRAEDGTLWLYDGSTAERSYRLWSYPSGEDEFARSEVEAEHGELTRTSKGTTEYLTLEDVGLWFGVKRETVSQWRRRYSPPKPDVVVGSTPGWSKDREEEWRKWHAEEGPGKNA